MGNNVFLNHVAPTFGNIFATLMLASPLPAALRMKRKGELGDLNPYPYPMTVVNSIGWIAYGYTIANPYVLPANIVGFLAGIVITLIAYGCAPWKVRDNIMAMMTFFAAHFILLGCISSLALRHKPDIADRMWGINANVLLMLYYVAPLSSMRQVILTRNAASIYPPLALTSVANGTMWTIYGFAIHDINIWLSNGIGAILAVVQLILRLVYGAKPTALHDTELGSLDMQLPSNRSSSEVPMLSCAGNGHGQVRSDPVAYDAMSNGPDLMPEGADGTAQASIGRINPQSKSAPSIAYSLSRMTAEDM